MLLLQKKKKKIQNQIRILLKGLSQQITTTAYDDHLDVLAA